MFLLSNMAIKTNLTDLRPAKEKFCREVPLLSKGFFNRKAFPAGTITVLPWDSAVDDWMAKQVQKGASASRNLLFNLLPRVCNLNGCKPDEFLASEVMLVMMVSRSILHEDAVTYTATCPDCGHAEAIRLSIPAQLVKVAEKPDDYPGYDVITLPFCKDIIHARPLTVKDELDVTGRTDEVRQRTVPDSAARALTGIVSIGGGAPDNVAELVAWFKALHPGDAEFLLKAFNDIQPELSRSVQHKCDDCGKEFVHILQLDEEFFRRGRAPEPRSALAPAVPASVQEPRAHARPAKSAGSTAAKAS